MCDATELFERVLDYLHEQAVTQTTINVDQSWTPLCLAHDNFGI
jgi:hypothetical protein